MLEAPKMTAKGVDVFYGDVHAIKGVDLDVLKGDVTALIGPSGCGKSTFLRCLNRMNDDIPGCRVTGDIKLDGELIYDGSMDVVQLRARVGMVFQKPNPFPKSVFDNVGYGPRIHGILHVHVFLGQKVLEFLHRFRTEARQAQGRLNRKQVGEIDRVPPSRREDHKPSSGQ